MCVSQDSLIRPIPRITGQEAISFCRIDDLLGYKPGAARVSPSGACNDTGDTVEGNIVETQTNGLTPGSGKLI